MSLVLLELQALAREGGWVFWALLVLAFGIAFAMLSLWRGMRFDGAPLLTAGQWRRLLRQPDASPELRQRLRAKSGGADLEVLLQEIDLRLFGRTQRRFVFAFVLIGAAPLLGLLGTVSGMLATFGGLAGSAARAPVDVISTGVSEALITTQTGLIIGVPGFIICSLMKGRFDQLRSAYDHLAAGVLSRGG